MESRSTSVVLRRIRPLAGAFRYYPYARTVSGKKEEMKEEVVRLGVELSLYVAQTMLLLCDDIGAMLWFCFKLWRGVLADRNPVLERLHRVMHYVNSKHIKPKNIVYQDGGSNSVQWELRTTWHNFVDGIMILSRLHRTLRRKVTSFDDRQLSWAIDKCKQQVLKKLEDELGPAKETVEYHNIFDLWKSLFDEEPPTSTIKSDLFRPIFGKPLRREILALRLYSRYILGNDFATEEVKEEVVRLGVELSINLARSMFALCDDIRTMLLFCYGIWRDVRRTVVNESHVADRLLRVMHYVNTKYIEPKKGVYQIDGGNSAQWGLICTTLDKFAAEFRSLNSGVFLLKSGRSRGLVFTPAIEEGVKKVEEKLGCVKGVSEANGFARDAMESNVLDMWKSLFDTEAKEATPTLKAIKKEMIRDLFLPLTNEAPPP